MAHCNLTEMRLDLCLEDLEMAVGFDRSSAQQLDLKQHRQHQIKSAPSFPQMT